MNARRIHKLAYLAFFICLLSLPLHAPHAGEDEAVPVEWAGFAGIASTLHSRFFTLGGPILKMKRGSWQGGISFFPSLRFEAQGSPHSINPQLGFGLTVEYQNFAVLLPFYSLKETDDSKASLKLAFGAGYRF